MAANQLLDTCTATAGISKAGRLECPAVSARKEKHDDQHEQEPDPIGYGRLRGVSSTISNSADQHPHGSGRQQFARCRGARRAH